jgi:outer membrane receptor protein involved in Fe transport
MTVLSDYFDEYNLEPRTSLEYNLTRNTLVTAGFGKYHQFPQGYQVIEGVGNPDLTYERADHYTAGVEQQFPDGLKVRVEGYYKKLYDLVVPHESENYVNGGSGKAYGGELLLKKDSTDDWWGWFSTAYSKTERRNDLTGEGFPYRYDQPWIINIIYNWAFRPKWTFGARWRYQSGAPYTPVTGTFTDSSGRIRPVYGELGSERLPDYHRLDLRVARDFLFNTWKMGFYMDIINAYAHENVSGYQYSENYTSREPITQLPFLISIGLKAEF